MGRILGAAVCGLFLLAGCSGGSLQTLNSTASSDGSAGAKLQGRVFGGQQPITGAHVYLFAANTTGYGGAGVAASSSNASISLLNASATGNSDALGAYVTTDGSGNFSITGDYTCMPGSQVYLYALGGNAGAGTNPAAGLMALLGNCPAAQNFLAATPFIFVNEVSTVAAAYAMAGFATDATHVSSSGTGLAQVGIANAFANAGNLETLSTGVALATTPVGNGTVPQAEIDTLADALAACVNSAGTVSGPTSPTPCYTLLNSALSGGSSGSMPTDTATAAINVAHHPGANVAALFGLATSTAPFQPALSAAPNDWAIGVTYAVPGLSTQSLAIDAAGDVWLPNSPSGGPYGVVELSSLGAILSGASGYSGGGLTSPNGVAIDPVGNVWVSGASSIVKLSPAGAVLSGASGYPVGGANAPFGVAVDGQGNVWAGDGSSVVKLDSSGNLLSGASGFSTGTGGAPTGVTIDDSGNAWSGSGNLHVVSELSSAGAVLSGSGYPVSMPGAESVAIDGYGNAWTNTTLGSSTGLNNVAKLSPAGAELSPTGGYANCVSESLPNNYVRKCIWWDPDAFAIDGRGNVWGEALYETEYNGPNPSPTYSTALSEISNTGTILSGLNGYTGGTALGPGSPPVQGSVGATPVALAVDGSGDVWMLLGATTTGTQVAELIGAAAPVVSPFSLGVKNGTLGMQP
jgi:streptogramin lyase